MINFLFLMLFLVVDMSYGESERPYNKMAYLILTEYNKELKSKYDFTIDMIGGSFVNDIKSINIGYAFKRPLNIQNARKLFVEISEGLLKKYNESKQIRPYLANYPFKIDNLELSLTFPEIKNNHDNNLVSFVLTAKGKIIYYQRFDTMKKEIFEEKYEDALRIINNDRSRQ